MPRLSLNLLKCLYSYYLCLPKTGTTLFINQKGYVHLEPPVVIRTVDIVVIKLFREMTAFLSRTPPPVNDVSQRQAGGEPTRCSAVPLPLPLNCDNVTVQPSFGVAPPTATAVVGGCHHSLVIVPLLQTIAVINLVLLLSPKRMPIPDHETCQRRATYNDNGGPALIHACGQLLSSARL